jgi:hypothetical protein
MEKSRREGTRPSAEEIYQEYILIENYLYEGKINHSSLRWLAGQCDKIDLNK